VSTDTHLRWDLAARALAYRQEGTKSEYATALCSA